MLRVTTRVATRNFSNIANFFPKIFSQIPNYENISFDEHPDANPASRLSNLKRFQMNPAPNWGPKMKAHTTQKQIQEKRNKNQGKTKRKLSLESENVQNDNRPIEQH